MKPKQPKKTNKKPYNPKNPRRKKVLKIKKSINGRPPKRKKNGRKIMDGEEQKVVAKLEQAFSIGCSDTEACLYANISRSTLDRYCKRNPLFKDRKELLKDKPCLIARKSVVEALPNDPKLALEYLTKKKPQEFGNKLDLSTNGENIVIGTMIPELKQPEENDYASKSNK